MNKWDKISQKESFDQNEIVALIRNSLPALSWAKILFISALEGTRCNRILEAVDLAITQYNRHVPTSILNEIDPLQPMEQGNRERFITVLKFQKNPLPSRFL